MKVFSPKIAKHKGDDKDRLWPCPSCKIPFRAASELQAHLSAHTKGEKTVPCWICGKLFASTDRVHSHIRAAHAEKSCSCNVSGSGCSFCCKLSDHMRSHSGDKPFHCDVCGKSFSQKYHLTRHSMIHTGERPYPCDFCGRAFYRKDKLTRHRRIHTVSPGAERHGRPAGHNTANSAGNTGGPSNAPSNVSNPNSTSNSPNNMKMEGSPAAPNPSGPPPPPPPTAGLNLAPPANLSLGPGLNPNYFRPSPYKPEWQGAPSGLH